MNISIFGAHASGAAITALVAKRNDKLQKPIYREFLDWDIPQVSLKFTSIVGSQRVAAMAAVNKTAGVSPLRNRAALAAYDGEIPYISHKYAMTEENLRTYLSLRDSSLITPEQQKRMILDYIWDDVKNAIDGVEARIDYLLLRMLSTAKIDLTGETNPDGVAYGKLSILPEASHILNPTKYWDDAASNPIKDIADACDTIEDEIGQRPEVIFMNKHTFGLIINNAKTADFFKKLGVAAVLMDLAKINEYFKANSIPEIRILNRKFKIEKAGGTEKKVDGFVNGAVTFAFSGKLGKVKNAINIQATRQQANKQNGEFSNVFDGVWVQKFSPNAETYTEYTKAEAIAMPALEALDSLFFFNALKDVITLQDELTKIDPLPALPEVGEGE